MKIIAAIKNTKLRYNEKLRHAVNTKQILRFIGMLLQHPVVSVQRGILKVMLGLTYRCQCTCVYCCSSSHPVSLSAELTTKKWEEIIFEITQIPSVITLVSFLGGEALLRNDVFALIEYASRRGAFTELESNGILLSHDNVMRLKRAGLHHTFVRIEGFCADAHDRLSNRAGCFEKAIEGIRNCLREKLSCSISTIALKEKIYRGDLERIICMARELQATSVRLLYPTLSGNLRNAESERINEYEKAYIHSLLEPDYVYLESTYTATFAATKECPSYNKKLFFISPYGEVRPCPFVSINFGNLRDHNVKKTILTMWENKIFQERNCFLCNQ